MERASQLLLDIVGGECGPVFAQCIEDQMPPIETISMRPQRIRDLLGLDVADKNIKQHLTDLQMQVDDSAVPWSVTRPSWRFDITAEHDLVEEIGRIEGLDKIEPKAPNLRAKPYSMAEDKVDAYRLKSWLASAAFREVVSYSFIAPADQKIISSSEGNEAAAIDLANPIASNMSQMRQSILPGLLNAARTNEQRQHGRIRLFEMGHIFNADSQSETGAKESEKLAIIAGGERDPIDWASQQQQTEFYDLKGDLDALFDRVGIASQIDYKANANHSALHPGRSADIILEGQTIGMIGALHPSAQKHFDLKQTYIIAELSLSALQSRRIPVFSNMSKFPETTRDLALLVEESVLAGDILKEIREKCGKLLKKCDIFDTYSGGNIKQGYKSLAFSLSLQSDSESLNSEFVDRLINDLLDSLNNKFNAKLRS